jgi:hypothetical protein
VKKLVTLLVAVLTFGVIPAVQADIAIFNSFSPEDRTQPADMNYRYEAISISVEIMDSNKSEMIIKANFASTLSADSFMNYGSAQPLLRIKIMNNLENYRNEAGYIWLDAPDKTPYKGATPIDATASIYADPKKGVTGGRVPLTACKVKTWMAPGPTSTWVAFSIDRVCADIADPSWVIGFIDSNIYASSFSLDSKYFPKEGFYLATQSVPRPIKMKDQAVAFVGSIATQNLDNPKVTSGITSSLNLPATVISLTPTICLPSLTGLVVTTALLKAGTCTLEAFALGNDVTNPSPRVTQSFTVNPKVMIKQDLSWNEPEEVTEGDEPFDLRLISSAGLPVVVTSTSPSVCQFNDPTRPSWVTIVGSGTCYLTAKAAATDKYFEASGSASFYVERKPVVRPTPTPSRSPSPSTTSRPTPRPTPTPTPTPTRTIIITATVKPQVTVTPRGEKGELPGNSKKKVTIVCLKGVTTKKVTEVKPVCPKGWTLKKP